MNTQKQHTIKAQKHDQIEKGQQHRLDQLAEIVHRDMPGEDGGNGVDKQFVLVPVDLHVLFVERHLFGIPGRGDSVKMDGIKRGETQKQRVPQAEERETVHQKKMPVIPRPDHVAGERAIVVHSGGVNTLFLQCQCLEDAKTNPERPSKPKFDEFENIAAETTYSFRKPKKLLAAIADESVSQSAKRRSPGLVETARVLTSPKPPGVLSTVGSYKGQDGPALDVNFKTTGFAWNAAPILIWSLVGSVLVEVFPARC